MALAIYRVLVFICGLTAFSAAIGSLRSEAQVGGKQSDDANAPTLSASPTAIDESWRRASAKYDSARSSILDHVDQVNREGAFHPDWESLRNYKVPNWYKDAKFGIFIHWGVYSVPAFGTEWYPRLMYMADSDEYKHHVAVYGPQDKFGYKDFIPRFKAEKFDPAAWAHLFKEAGAKYVVPVFEHHDGFAMYDSGLSDWTAAKMGPHRDLVGDLAKAVRAEGLHLGASSHRVEHNFFLGAPMPPQLTRTRASGVLSYAENNPDDLRVYVYPLDKSPGDPPSAMPTGTSQLWLDNNIEDCDVPPGLLGLTGEVHSSADP